MFIKLLKARIYVHEGKSYERGKTYPVSEEVGNYLLEQENSDGLPVFILAKETAATATKKAAMKKATDESSKKAPAKGKAPAKNKPEDIDDTGADLVNATDSNNPDDVVTV